MTEKPRALTRDEVRDLFLDHVRNMISYWESEKRTPDIRGKLEGLAYSILVTIDGEAGDLPAFQLIPNPYDEDEDFCRENGENWYPSGVDIGGSLHEQLHTRT